MRKMQEGDALFGAMEFTQTDLPPIEIVRFKVTHDGQLSLVIDGAEVWAGPDATAFAIWLRELVAIAKERAITDQGRKP